VALSAQLRFEANAKASFALRLLIKFDIGAMERGRSFVAIKQNAEGCAAASVGRRLLLQCEPLSLGYERHQVRSNVPDRPA
jgi:hypothetical protein